MGGCFTSVIPNPIPKSRIAGLFTDSTKILFSFLSPILPLKFLVIVLVGSAQPCGFLHFNFALFCTFSSLHTPLALLISTFLRQTPIFQKTLLTIPAFTLLFPLFSLLFPSPTPSLVSPPTPLNPAILMESPLLLLLTFFPYLPSSTTNTS